MRIEAKRIASGPAEGGVETLCNRCGESCWRFVRTGHASCATCGGTEWCASAETIEEQNRREAIMRDCPECQGEGGREVPLDPPETWGLYAAHVEYDGGYMSDPLHDLTRYSFDLCETCLLWLCGQLQLPVTVTNIMPGHVGEPDPGEAERVAAQGKAST